MLNVFVGYGCNVGCSYCLQAPMAERDRVPPQKIEKFMERVVPYVKEKGINKIAYWGGEPILYWPTIEALHEGMRKEGIEFKMVKVATNATLLEKKHVDKLNDWGAHVIVSRHIGQKQPKWEMLPELKRFSLSYLFTAKNLFAWPWFAEMNRLEAELQTRIFPYMHWVRATNGCDDSHHLDHIHLNAHIPHLWDIARLAVNNHAPSRNLWLSHLMEWAENLQPGKEAVPMCFGDHQIDVDLEGNRYGCHHTVTAPLKIGQLGGPVENEAAALQVRRFVDTAECSACPLKTWCRGNCHLSRTHDADCRLSKEKHKIMEWISERWYWQRDVTSNDQKHT